MQVSVLLLLTAIQLHSTLTQGTVIEGPSNVTYLPGVTPLPIELTCDVTGTAIWRVNDADYTLTRLTNGDLPGHSRTGDNILVDSPMNNTEYICVSLTSDNETTSDPAYIIIASVPAMVSDVDVDSSTFAIVGNNVTLTLSWEEPFNNLDPIEDYTVSCSGDDTCPEPFTTTDNTTRSYTITNLAPKTSYTFSVVATNSVGSGEAGVVTITTPVIGKVTGVMLICMVDQIIQCNLKWNPVTQGDVTGYQVYYNGTMMNVNSSTTTLTFIAPLLLDGVFTDTVVVMVTAVSNIGVGPASDPAIAVINASSVISTTTTFMSPVTSELYNINVTCTIHPNLTADQCVVMAMANGKMTKSGSAPIINGTATVTVNGLECGINYNIARGIFNNGTLVGPTSSHGNTSQLCPLVVIIESDPDNTIYNIVIIILAVIIVGGGVEIIIVIIIYRKKNNSKPRSSYENLHQSSLSSPTQGKGGGEVDGVIAVMFSNPVYCVTKNAGPAQPTLVLSKPSTIDITVKVTSDGISATGGGIDELYTVKFPAGKTIATIDVPINVYDKLKSNEYFMLTIDKTSLPRDVMCGSPGQATVTIVDDDSEL